MRIEVAVMETGQKVLIGIGLTAAVGSVAAYYGTKALVGQVQRHHRRSKVKGFVNDKLNGNAQLMNLVDNMSDDDIDNLLNAVNRMSDVRDQLVNYSDDLKTFVNGVWQNAKDYTNEKLAR